MANDRVRPRKRKKVCSFCVDKIAHIDYKDSAKLRRYLSERGKILPRRTTGTCAAHQRGNQKSASDRSAALRRRLISLQSNSVPQAAARCCFPLWQNDAPACF